MSDEKTRDNAKELRRIINSINEKRKKKLQKNGSKESNDVDLIFIAKEEIEYLTPETVPCNVPEVNNALNGGFVKGAFHLISGAKGAGKTALSLSVMKEIQNQGMYVLYILTEPPFPFETARKLGLDMDMLLVIEPRDNAEEIIEATEQFLINKDTGQPKGLIGGLVFDSINNLIPEKQINRLEEKGYASDGMTERARMLTTVLENMQGRGMLRGTKDSHGIVGILIAQMRANLSGYGSPTQISGGLAPGFNSKIVMTLSQKMLTQTEPGGKAVPVGQEVTVDISKNNINGVPRKVTYIYDFEKGIDPTIGIITQAEEANLIYKQGRIYYFVYGRDEEGNPLIAEGPSQKPARADFLRENPHIMQGISTLIRNKENYATVVTAANAKQDDSSEELTTDEVVNND